MADYTYQQKIKYYEKRANNKSLTSGQRFYAVNFLDGAKQGAYECEKGRFNSISVKGAKELVALNENRGGDVAYFKGRLAAIEHYSKKGQKRQ